MNKEKICLLATGAICIIGCMLIFVYDLVEGNYTQGEIISRLDYSERMSADSTAGAETEQIVSSGDKQNKGTVNINTASAQEIMENIQGIGPTKAQAIVEYRERIGSFVSVDELINVEGIGEKTLEKIKPYCRVND